MKIVTPIIPRAGTCDVCEKTTLLCVRCAVTNLVVGRCCQAELLSATKLIDAHVAHGGLRHPEPGEMQSP